MARTIGIGIQSFTELIEGNYFYVDKTSFIKEWWESGDSVTLITRPRRFGKTLNMSMLETFFSVNYMDRGDLFKGLSIWQEEKYRRLQGTYPVIFISFASVKEKCFDQARKKICRIIKSLYNEHDFLLEGTVLNESEKEAFRGISVDMEDNEASYSLHALSLYLSRYYGKKVIILLDEYDTPMQEAWVNGYWEEMVGFTRGLFNSTFKTNPYLARAIMTGITRVSKESIFSDLNNLKVVTTTSHEYDEAFGFTEEEVFAALDESGLSAEKKEVKRWYDGFTFGSQEDIYNPWSILNFLDTGKYETYWANTSSNSLVGKLLREGSKRVKSSFEMLLEGGVIRCPVDEQIVYNQLEQDESAIWSLLLAGGYLKVLLYESQGLEEYGVDALYDLTLTNYEVERMFRGMIRSWFRQVDSDYNDFVKALLMDDLDAMNEYMNRVAQDMFSYFDTGRKGSGRVEPERFYHGFVLGLMVELRGRYVITSNRESGFGRYDVVLEPISNQDDAMIIEFKVYNPRKEKSLEETLQNALQQIDDKAYSVDLRAKGISEERIRKYGFAFEGKNVLIG